MVIIWISNINLYKKLLNNLYIACKNQNLHGKNISWKILENFDYNSCFDNNISIAALIIILENFDYNIIYMNEIFGKPNEGIHSYRLFNIAIVDVIMTFILAYVL